MDVRAEAVSEDRAKAIIKTQSGLTKVYRDGCDWWVQGPTGQVRYFSVWQGDVIGSLKRAVRAVLDSVGDSFSEEDIVYTCGI